MNKILLPILLSILIISCKKGGPVPAKTKNIDTSRLLISEIIEFEDSTAKNDTDQINRYYYDAENRIINHSYTSFNGANISYTEKCAYDTGGNLIKIIYSYMTLPNDTLTFYYINKVPAYSRWSKTNYQSIYTYNYIFTDNYLTKYSPAIDIYIESTDTYTYSGLNLLKDYFFENNDIYYHEYLYGTKRSPYSAINVKWKGLHFLFDYGNERIQDKLTNLTVNISFHDDYHYSYNQQGYPVVRRVTTTNNYDGAAPSPLQVIYYKYIPINK